MALQVCIRLASAEMVSKRSSLTCLAVGSFWGGALENLALCSPSSIRLEWACHLGHGRGAREALAWTPCRTECYITSSVSDKATAQVVILWDSKTNEQAHHTGGRSGLTGLVTQEVVFNSHPCQGALRKEENTSFLEILKFFPTIFFFKAFWH